MRASLRDLKTALLELEERPRRTCEALLRISLKRSAHQAKRSSNEVLFKRSALSPLPSIMKISTDSHKAKNIADTAKDFADSRATAQRFPKYCNNRF